MQDSFDTDSTNSDLKAKDDTSSCGSGVMLRKKDFFSKFSLGRSDGVSAGARRISCKDLGNGDCEGWLLRRRQQSMNVLCREWMKCWCKLLDKQLYVFDKSTDLKARAMFDLSGFLISPVSDNEFSKKFVFKVQHEKFGLFYFASDRLQDMAKWMNKLQLACLHGSSLNNNSLQERGGYSESEEEDDDESITSTASANSSSSSGSSGRSSHSYWVDTPNKPDPTESNADYNILLRDSGVRLSGLSLDKSTPLERMTSLKLSAAAAASAAGATGSVPGSPATSLYSCSSPSVTKQKHLCCHLVTARRALKDKLGELDAICDFLKAPTINPSTLRQFLASHPSSLQLQQDAPLSPNSPSTSGTSPCQSPVGNDVPPTSLLQIPSTVTTVAADSVIVSSVVVQEATKISQPLSNASTLCQDFPGPSDSATVGVVTAATSAVSQAAREAQGGASAAESNSTAATSTAAVAAATAAAAAAEDSIVANDATVAMIDSGSKSTDEDSTLQESLKDLIHSSDLLNDVLDEVVLKNLGTAADLQGHIQGQGASKSLGQAAYLHNSPFCSLKTSTTSPPSAAIKTKTTTATTTTDKVKQSGSFVRNGPKESQCTDNKLNRVMTKVKEAEKTSAEKETTKSTKATAVAALVAKISAATAAEAAATTRVKTTTTTTSSVTTKEIAATALTVAMAAIITTESSAKTAKVEKPAAVNKQSTAADKTITAASTTAATTASDTATAVEAATSAEEHTMQTSLKHFDETFACLKDRVRSLEEMNGSTERERSENSDKNKFNRKSVDGKLCHGLTSSDHAVRNDDENATKDDVSTANDNTCTTTDDVNASCDYASHHTCAIKNLGRVSETVAKFQERAVDTGDSGPSPSVKSAACVFVGGMAPISKSVSSLAGSAAEKKKKIDIKRAASEPDKWTG